MQEDLPNMDIEELKRQATELRSVMSRRDSLFTDMEQMYFMEDDEIEKATKRMDGGKLTLSPDPRNQLQGAVRLMLATDPQFSVPEDENEEIDSDLIGRIEKFTNQMFSASGRLTGVPVHFDYILSAMLYGEAHVAVVPTNMLLAKAKSKADRMRKEKAVGRTPYLFQVYRPKNCYYEMDALGLTAHLRVETTTAAEVERTYGVTLSRSYGSGRTNSVVLNEWWDLENHAIWVDGESEPIINEPHNLPFIPIVVQISEGSWSLFEKDSYQAQPFLYTVSKSNTWRRQNLILTTMMTNVHNMGLNPQLLYQTDTPGKTLDIDYSIPGGVASINAGENLSPLANSNLINPAVLQMMDIVNNMSVESTMYKQVFGEPLGKNAPYSMVALLSQAGRLPLVSPQRRLGWGLAKAAEIALLWSKDLGQDEIYARQGQSTVTLNTSEIPDDIEIECLLEISLPQDNLQNANVAAALTQGPNPLTSVSWVQENILRIGQPDEMQKAIWAERISNMLAQQYIEQQLQQLQQPEQPPGGELPGAGPAPGGPQQDQGVSTSPNIPLTPGMPPQQAGLPPLRSPEEM